MTDRTRVEEHAGETYALNREEALRAHAALDDFAKQNNQAAIDSGTLAIKTAFLINGGAAAAMLAFIGSVVAQGRIRDDDLQVLANCLFWFAAGVAFAGAATAFTYFTNYTTAGTATRRTKTWSHPYLGAVPKSWACLRHLFLCLTIFTGLGALSLFVFGMYQVKNAVATIKIVAPPATDLRSR